MNKYQQALKKTMEMLPNIVRATVQGSYVFTPEPIYSILVKKGLGEVNTDIENPEVSGEFATRATQKGIDECPAPEAGNIEANDQDTQEYNEQDFESE